MTSTLTRAGIEAHITDQWTIQVFDAKAPGPAVIKPMIQLRSELDRCPSMRVTPADYADPDRWWL